MSEAPKELYFYDDWLAQHTEGKMLCGNNRYLHENHVDALLKAEREKALREAAVICNQSYGGSIGDVHKAILALISEDATDG